jgi:hypothetical protein
MEGRRFLAGRIGPVRSRQLLLGFAILALLAIGILLREYTWRQTTHLRFQRDIVNGFYWGTQTLAEGHQLSPKARSDSWPVLIRGYLGLYDQVEDDAFENNFYLDYPPLRLLVMSIWAREVRSKFPGAEDGTPEYVEPLLTVNTIFELLTAFGVFLLVRLGVRRASGATDLGWLHRLPLETRGWIAGLLAASVTWLDPSLILDAHAWPQWDSWILPFYLFAALAALNRRCFACGCLLALGGMLKGQLLFVAPFFLFWPLWQKRWGRAGKVLAGFLATFAFVVSPWILKGAASWAIVAGTGLIVTAVCWRVGWQRYWPWIAGLTAAAAFTVGILNHGSFAWLRIGYLYGSERYPYLFISSCYNLPSLLSNWNFSLKQILWSLHFGSFQIAFTLQWILRALYLVALILCALGAARQARRRDPRLLIAIATPWLLMFALLGQMHERYLLWGAVLSAVALGVSVRLSVLHFAFSGMSAIMITQVLLMDKKLGPTLSTIDFLEHARPLASCLLLVCVGVYLREVLSGRAPIFRPRRKPAAALGEAPIGLAVAVEEA